MGRMPVSIDTRHQIIVLLMDKNKTNTEIARLVGVSEKCVRTTRKNYGISEDGQIVGEFPKPGRPNKLTPRDKNYIYLQVRKKS